MPEPVIAIFDIGKTNKKLLLFNESYHVVYKRSVSLPEIEDEDGFPCEDIHALVHFMYESLDKAMQLRDYTIRAINFSAYGASFVWLDASGKFFNPLYNYLKPYPESVRKNFYERYGGERAFSVRTASPALGSLNSGLQLFRIRYEKPEVFEKISVALHLPQFLSYVFTKRKISEITSVGCHTNLWDFQEGEYHPWVVQEGVAPKLPPMISATETIEISYKGIRMRVGTGLHDSSAALIPYLLSVRNPFLLLSTGTWCISLNPFNAQPLTPQELEQDTLCYLTYTGKPVKASRLFLGALHEEQVKRIASFFQKDAGYFLNMPFNAQWMDIISKRSEENEQAFETMDLTLFSNEEEAYHQLMYDIVQRQKNAIRLVMEEKICEFCVDGGFSSNALYMNMLASMFPHVKVYAAAMTEGSALGAALVIHQSWNTKPLGLGWNG